MVIRADANTNIGAGHVLRCLALAQAWQGEGRRVLFFSVELPPWLETRLRKEKIEIIPLAVQAGSPQDALQTAQFSKNQNASWIVLDGYHFDSSYHKTVKDSGLKILVLDDNGSSYHYYADIILNQNLHAHEKLYPHREPHSRLLLGTRYVLLRNDFFQWRSWKRPDNPKPNKILVMLGGGDPDNVTLKVITALQAISSPEIESIIVVGGSNPHYEVLHSQVQKAGARFQIKRDVINLPELMAWADIAISAAGTTTWELAFMMLPSLLLVLSKNQELVAKQLDLKGIAINLNRQEDISIGGIAAAVSRLLESFELRATMSESGKHLIDGEGSQRVLMHLDGKKIRIKKVGLENCQLIWEWANDPEVRQSSFSSNPIPWEEHIDWFKRKANDSHCYFFIALDQLDIPIGQVRFDVKENEVEAEINVSVKKQVRGLGYGTLLLNLAADKMFNSTGIEAIHSFVKTDNPNSIGAFKGAGYQNIGFKSKQGKKAVHLVRKKNYEKTN